MYIQKAEGPLTYTAQRRLEEDPAKGCASQKYKYKYSNKKSDGWGKKNQPQVTKRGYLRQSIFSDCIVDCFLAFPDPFLCQVEIYFCYPRVNLATNLQYMATSLMSSIGVKMSDKEVHCLSCSLDICLFL